MPYDLVLNYASTIGFHNPSTNQCVLFISLFYIFKGTAYY